MNCNRVLSSKSVEANILGCAVSQHPEGRVNANALIKQIIKTVMLLASRVCKGPPFVEDTTATSVVGSIAS